MSEEKVANFRAGIANRAIGIARERYRVAVRRSELYSPASNAWSDVVCGCSHGVAKLMCTGRLMMRDREGADVQPMFSR